MTTGAAPAASSRLARNTLLNAIGLIVPLVAAIAATPSLIQTLGTERFGLLALAWTVVGYFSILELGLGRSLTQAVAQRLAMGASSSIPPLATVALLTMTALGVVAGGLCAALAPWACQWLPLSGEVRSEAVPASLILALAVPAVVLTSGLSGILEAYQRFDLLSLLRTLTGTAVIVVPLALAASGGTLSTVFLGLVVTRWLGALLLLYWVGRMPVLCGPRWDSFTRELPEILSTGLWINLSNILSPFLVTIDRFAIAAVMTPAAVTYYATPYEMATKLWILPGMLTGALFPALAAAATAHRHEVDRLCQLSLRWIHFASVPPALLMIWWAPELLEVWLGAELASHSRLVFQILVAAVVINCHSHVPFIVLQATARADLIAKSHLLQLPIYGVILSLALMLGGIVGAAIAWFARIVLDTALLFSLARHAVQVRADWSPGWSTAVLANLLLGCWGADWPWIYRLILNGLQLTALGIAAFRCGLIAAQWARLQARWQRRSAVTHPLASSLTEPIP